MKSAIFAYLCILAFAIAPATGSAAAEYKKGDSIEVYFQHDGAQSSNAEWTTIDCLETQEPLKLLYGKDAHLQCSIKTSSKLYAELQKGELKTRLRKSRSGEYIRMATMVDSKRAGGFNFVLHGSSGRVVAAGLYPVMESTLPKGVEGVVTLLFNVKWYAGGGLAVLMANQRYEEEFIIQPVVALMFCILTACLVYVVGRVYVEGWVIPKVLKQRCDMVDDKLGESKKSI
ncbi:hypothetical protein LPJ56_000969 [Coemansia sp. RSA 2599]|nr:hypothetical protein LPJ75_000226 [Coemansia sp. RSA 2598]KAJ1828658.1 hypothetical protein LPJ56_000969 [Coemansia sp. RSA 2599]